MVWTHAELVKIAVEWLKRKNPIVASEVTSGHETADAIGWDAGWSTLVECKISRSDFKSDVNKLVRTHPYLGMGHFRYYMTPKGLLDASVMAIPYGWGLLEVDDYRHTWVKPPTALPQEYDAQAEIVCLMSVLRRLPVLVEGISIRHYTHMTKSTATVSIESLISTGEYQGA